MLVDVTRITRVELHGDAGTPLTLTRQAGHWLRNGQNADELGAKVLESLKGLVAEAIWKLKADPKRFESPWLRVELVLDDDTRHKLTVGEPKLWRDAKTRFVRSDSLPVSFLVDETRLMPLFDLL